MVKTAALYLVPIKSYSIYSQLSSILKRIVVFECIESSLQFCEKNESHQMKLKDMSFDVVLHADSEYTLCSVI